MKHTVLGLALAVGLSGVVAVAGSSPFGPEPLTGTRAYIALAHPGQVVAPHLATDTNATAFFLYDKQTRRLSFTLSEGDAELVWSIHGPARPGEQGPFIGGGPWSPMPLGVGPLTDDQVKALRRGRLYLRVVQPSALPEPPRAMRGQLLPVPGVRY